MKKTKRGEKGREWEKERRDKLNAGFHELCKLLPDHDPGITMSKMEIIRKATDYIKHLQEKNEEIIKCGKDNFLKSETERLKKRVAYLILKTTELVDALRKAGVPIPSKSRKRIAKRKAKEAFNPLNQQNKDLSHANKLQENNETSKSTVKKKVKCGCEKKNKINKKPLAEVNPMVSADFSKCTSGVSELNSASVNLNEVTSPASVHNQNKDNDNNLLNTCVPQIVVTQNDVTHNLITQNAATSVVTRSIMHPVMQTSVNMIKHKQTLSMDKREISKLGPGTLIFADGRIVNVPPAIPQIVVKPPPSAPPPAVIVMQTPELALKNPVVKISTSDDKREKLIVPKRREITMTTFVNKVPIPAVKAFKLESCARDPRPRKKLNKDQKKNLPKDTSSTSTTNTTVAATLSTINSLVTVLSSEETALSKRKCQEEPKLVKKNSKNNDKNETINGLSEETSENQTEKEDRLQVVKHSINEFVNKELGNEVNENLEIATTSTKISMVRDSASLICSHSESDVLTTSGSSVPPKSQDLNVTKTTLVKITTEGGTEINTAVTVTLAEDNLSNNRNVANTLKISPPLENISEGRSSIKFSPVKEPTITQSDDSISSPRPNKSFIGSLSLESAPLPSPTVVSQSELYSCSLQTESSRFSTIASAPISDLEKPRLVEPSSNSETLSLCNDTSKTESLLTTNNSEGFNMDSALLPKTNVPSSYPNLSSTNNAICNSSNLNSTSSGPKKDLLGNELSETTSSDVSASLNAIVPTPHNPSNIIHPTTVDVFTNTPPLAPKISVTAASPVTGNINPIVCKCVSGTENEFFLTTAKAPISSLFNSPQEYSTPKTSATSVPHSNTMKNTGTYVANDVFSNNIQSTSKAPPSFNIPPVYSYNTPDLSKNLPSYNMDIFVNSNSANHTPTSTSGNLNGGNSYNISATAKSSSSFVMPQVSTCNAQTLSKTAAPYSMADVFVTNIHLSPKSSSTFSVPDGDSCCVPSSASKRTSACCMNNEYTSGTSLPSKSTYTKNNLFPAITTSTYRTSSNFGMPEGILHNSTAASCTSRTSFNMTGMFTHSVTTTSKVPTTFTMSDMYSSYSAPLPSSKTSTFNVPEVFTSTPSTSSKVSPNTFTMADIYTSNITTKTTSSYTIGDNCSSTVTSTATFTVSNVTTDRTIKPCEQITPTLPHLGEHMPLFDINSQHKLPSAPRISTSKAQGTTEKDKIYPSSSMSGNYKNDQCNEFLRSTKEIDRSFMPIMDDVRLTSDFSNDLFNTLQVPTGGHHAESISPTAAFLLAFPLVSTSKNTENLAETENHDNHTSTPTTILQIGNIEPPSTELFHNMDFGKNKDFEMQTDLDYKSKQKPKQRNTSTFTQSCTSYPIFPNDYNHQCDISWSKLPEKKKQDKTQKYQYDCYKQDKKKRKISVNWMTTPESDMYKETEYTSNGHYNIEMETFPELCNNKKNHANYSWSPSKSLLPLDNPLMIPSTLPTLVGDLALGTTTPSDPFKRCEKKDKQEDKKFAQPKSQTANFLSVSQLVDPKCKKQKPSERQYKQKQQSLTTSSSDKKRHCMGQSSHQRDYPSSKRKEPNDPCMYSDNFVPHFNWDNKHRYKGGSYSAESLIQQDASDTFNFNYQQNNFFQNAEFGHDNGQAGCGQYQNFFNFPQGHFSSCVSEEYPSENFTLTSQSNNRMTGHIAQSGLHTSNEKQRIMGAPRDGHVREENGYQCGSSNSGATFHHYSHHHHHHQQQLQQQLPQSQSQHPGGYSSTNLQHNFSSIGGPGNGPPPPPPLPPPVSNYSVTATSTLANFNLSTIFPEMNDQRVGTAPVPSSRNHLNTNFSNSQSYRGHVTMQ